jgi:hypothetical protein
MTKAQKLFRRLWRINAVLILLGAGVIIVGIGSLLISELGWNTVRRREARAAVPVGGAADSSLALQLGRVSVVPGTNVMRADLFLGQGLGGFSSKGYFETRNILFIESDQKEARWLLPDNNHVINDTSEINDDPNPKAKRTIATAALVKSPGDGPEAGTGRLLLFDPSGRKVVEVATNVRALLLTQLSNGSLTILFERNRRLVTATFEPELLGERNEHEIDVPQLK